MKGIPWTPSELFVLKQLYANADWEELSMLLPKRTKSMIYGKASELDLKRDNDTHINKGQHFSPETQFKPGLNPFNKGKKQEQYMTPEAIEKTKATRFKEGQLPANTLHDNAITVRKDKFGRKYQYIRIGLARWKPLHQHKWVEKNGSIPFGHIVVFKDGNTMNTNDDNLELISWADNATRNRLAYLAKETAKEAVGVFKEKKVKPLKIIEKPKPAAILQLETTIIEASPLDQGRIYSQVKKKKKKEIKPVKIAIETWQKKASKEPVKFEAKQLIGLIRVPIEKGSMFLTPEQFEKYKLKQA